MKDHQAVSQIMVSCFGRHRHESSHLRNWSITTTTTIATTSSFAVPFVQVIYSYRPETNLVSRAYNVAASLYLQYRAHRILLLMIHILYFYGSTFQRMCTMLNMALSIVPWCASQVCCSGIYWMILRWFQFPLLWLVSLLFLHYYCCYYYYYYYYYHHYYSFN